MLSIFFSLLSYATVKILTVKNLDGKKQFIDLSMYGDGRYTSRYEVNEKVVKPISYKMYGPGFILFPTISTSIIYGIIVLIITLTSRYCKPRRILKETMDYKT